MNRSWPLPTALAALAAYSLAVLGGTITRLDPWYHGLRQPEWAPPDGAFGVIWTVVFALAVLAAIAAWRAAPTRSEASTLVALFAINGFLGIVWSMVFFRAERPDWALGELVLFWLSIAALIVACGRYSRTAALLLLPYIAWVSFAGVLNFEIVARNGPF
jgi:tryptophan-rich sensory protein